MDPGDPQHCRIDGKVVSGSGLAGLTDLAAPLPASHGRPLGIAAESAVPARPVLLLLNVQPKNTEHQSFQSVKCPLQ